MDTYGSELREGLKRSMARPAMTMRPLYSRMAEDTTPRLARRERRHRKWRRIYFNLKDDLGLYLWLIAGLAGCMVAWLAFNALLEYLR